MAIQDQQITFHSDQIKTYGPKVDGSFNVTLSVGEYERDKVAQLMLLPTQTVAEVNIKLQDNIEQKQNKENVENEGGI